MVCVLVVLVGGGADGGGGSSLNAAISDVSNSDAMRHKLRLCYQVSPSLFLSSPSHATPEWLKWLAIGRALDRD